MDVNSHFEGIEFSLLEGKISIDEGMHYSTNSKRLINILNNG